MFGGESGGCLGVCLRYFGRFSEGKHTGKLEETQRINNMIQYYLIAQRADRRPVLQSAEGPWVERLMN